MTTIILSTAPAATYVTAVQLSETGTSLINLINSGGGGTGDLSLYVPKSETGQFASATSLGASGSNLFNRDTSISGGLQANLTNTGASLYNRVSNIDNVADVNKPISNPVRDLLLFKSDIAPQAIYLSGATALTLNSEHWDYLDSDKAYTINGSPTGGEFFSLYLINTGASRFVSFPASFRLTENATITGLTIPMGRQELYAKRYPTEWSLSDTIATSDGLPPEDHAASHNITGSDAITITQNQVTDLVADLALLAPISDGTLTGTYLAPTATSGTNTNQIATTAFVRSITDSKANLSALGTFPCSYGFALGDETTAITTGTKVTFRMPHAMTLTGVRAELITAQAAGNLFTVDLREGGTTVFSTKPTIDNGEDTSVTAVTQPVISDAALADNAKMSIDVFDIGDGNAAGAKFWILGTRSL